MLHMCKPYEGGTEEETGGECTDPFASAPLLIQSYRGPDEESGGGAADRGRGRA